uniref:transposase domain-containing protein n=1 Tax=Paenibacillus sedimenti TaxID=2770274 RepID=UPI001CB73FD2|nr:transposase domain-containing protein [Paenibacillus sedimenti]
MDRLKRQKKMGFTRTNTLMYLFEQLPQLPDPKDPDQLDELLPWSPSLQQTSREFKS